MPLGAGRLTRSHLDGDPPSAEAVKKARKYARATIAEVVGKLRRAGDPQIAVASSKTFKQMARLAGAAPSTDGIYVRRTLTREDLSLWVPRLAAMTEAERATLPGVSDGRAGQLIAGAIVAEAAMDLLDLDELVISPWALREGVILHRMDTLPA